MDRNERQSAPPPALTHLTNRGLDLAVLLRCVLKMLQALPANVQDNVKTSFSEPRRCLRQDIEMLTSTGSSTEHRVTQVLASPEYLEPRRIRTLTLPPENPCAVSAPRPARAGRRSRSR